MVNTNLWQVHYIGGGKSLEADTHTVYESMKNNGAEDILWIESVSMRPYIDRCIEAMKSGILFGNDGLFFSYIEGESYSIIDPALGADDEVYSEREIRRKLQHYYIGNRHALEEDMAYLASLAIRKAHVQRVSR